MLHALIPLKDPAHGKSRLQSQLPAAERTRLSLTMLEQVSACLLASPEIAAVHVVTPSPEHVPAGCHFIAERAQGLNAALEQSLPLLAGLGATRVLIATADVPFVCAPDVQALLAAAAHAHVVAAPDWRGEGTNALLLTPPGCIATRFGAASLAAHERAARQAGRRFLAVRCAGLAQDIDAAEQLAELLRREPLRYGFLRARLEGCPSRA